MRTKWASPGFGSVVHREHVRAGAGDGLELPVKGKRVVVLVPGGNRSEVLMATALSL
jgi:hypothetical protein